MDSLGAQCLDGLRRLEYFLGSIRFRDRPVQPLRHLSARVFTRTYAVGASAAGDAGYSFVRELATPTAVYSDRARMVHHDIYDDG